MLDTEYNEDEVKELFMIEGGEIRAREIARNFLKAGSDEAFVSENTGLSMKIVAGIKAEIEKERV